MRDNNVISGFFRLPAICLLAAGLLVGFAACKSSEPAQTTLGEQPTSAPTTTGQASDDSMAAGTTPAASGQTTSDTTATSRAAEQAAEATAGQSGQSDIETLYWERVNQSRMNFTEADVHFMVGMIAHHAQALVMSRLAPQNGASPQIRTLCARIINSQQDEIDTMQNWLRDRGRPVPEIHIDGLNLMIHLDGEHMTHHMDMPGVLTQKQLEQLGSAQGREFDRLFLLYMIEHHKGAVTMVENLFAVDGAAQDDEAFRLASAIHVDQITEIERMSLMLNSLTDSGGL